MIGRVVLVVSVGSVTDVVVIGRGDVVVSATGIIAIESTSLRPKLPLSVSVVQIQWTSYTLPALSRRSGPAALKLARKSIPDKSCDVLMFSDPPFSEPRFGCVVWVQDS